MATQITWTDSIGSATLANGKAVPADRFRHWTPEAPEVSSSEVPVGDGITQRFLFRRDYIAAFELPYLKSDKHATALRLKAHLLGGGEITVYVGDQSGHEYDCVLAPGTTPALVFEDATMLEFTFQCAVKHMSQSALVADY